MDIPQISKIRTTVWSTILLLGVYPKGMKPAHRRRWLSPPQLLGGERKACTRQGCYHLDPWNKSLSPCEWTPPPDDYNDRTKSAQTGVGSVSLICWEPGSQRPEPLGTQCNSVSWLGKPVNSAVPKGDNLLVLLLMLSTVRLRAIFSPVAFNPALLICLHFHVSF